MTQVFLYAGTTSFPDPGDWDPVGGKVECLGPGGPAGATSGSHMGGGGGGYAWGDNLDPAFPVTIQVGGAGQNTFWRGDTNQPGNVRGMVGLTPTTAGGYGGSFYPNGFAGGRGAFRGSWGAGAGGGAAGPNGAGLSPSYNNSASINGAAGDAGFGGVGGAPNVAGGPGAEWDALHGCGGSGGGSLNSTAVPGAAGGLYGGAGGGAPSGQAYGPGALGLMVITWTPFIPAPPRPMVMVIS